MDRHQGDLISFEGIEGCGKSTQIKLAAEFLEKQGFQVLVTREPGATPMGREIRRLLLSPDFSPEAVTELFLYLADRREHVQKVIKPQLERGCLVLVDRYVDSTWVYQGYARNGDLDLITRLNKLVTGGLFPRRTFLLDCPPELGLQRARSRNQTDGSQGNEDRFEQLEIAFHQRVQDGFMQLAKEHPKRFMILDGSQEIQTIHLQISRVLQDLYVV
ncbi:MAG: dTMP kinase [Pseudomonadota bacterium]|nr:dTMP kinase [Pseudomonadota bacterium]